MTQFAKLNPTFSNELSKQFPKLSASELHFCALVKLNLSFKEIGLILQITHQSVFTKKYRIKKKMELEDDDAFYKTIQSI